MTFGGPFLTDLDERARVKGSRDPLGIQPIWTMFGRDVVGNLTTVSNSVRDFTVTILGCYFAERVAVEHELGTELAGRHGQRRQAALIRIENKRQFLEVNPDVLEQVDPILYGDP